MKVTQQMVADGAGVSIATVSRALAGHPAIPADTRRRIEQVARRLGYKPGNRGTAARARRVSTVGILVASNAAGILPPVLAGISTAAGQATLSTAVHVLADGNPAALEEQIAQWPPLAAGSLCGVIAVGWWPETTLANTLGTVPHVILGGGDNADQLRPDTIAETALAYQHLRDRGHREIGFCHGDVDTLEEALRIATFCHAERNLGTNEPTVAAIADHPTIRQLTISRLTAWICTSHDTADRLRTIVAEAKLQVPRDLSVVALSDSGRPQTGGWSSISYDWQTAGALALARLQSRIATGDLPPTVTLLTGQLGTDATLAPPPGANRRS